MLSVLGLGVGATTGIVPRAGEVTTVRAAAADAGPRPADREEQLLATIPQAIELVSSAPAEGPTGESEVSTPASPQTGAPTGSAPEPEPESVPVTAPEGSEGEEAVDGGAPVPPPAPSVPRRQPSTAEVDQAIEGVRPYIRSLIPLRPTRAQVAELGAKICTALDEGQTMDQVKATGAELVKKVPFASLREGGADYIVRSGVALYCPGHGDKLA